jgi:hypothetical protein
LSAHPRAFITRGQGGPRSEALLWLLCCTAIGWLLLTRWADSCQQDAPLHFLFARWAWRHPVLFVDVWSRPLFTLLYSLPAQINYDATRMFSLLISLGVAWQTWRLADESRMARAPLAVALVWMQPSFFLFAVENMTEPIFALVYVIALRLHHRGWIKTGMFVASLMILARPEGFFLCLLWAVFQNPGVQSPGFSLTRLLTRVPLLASGALLWWAAAWAIAGDPLFLQHNWPANWPLTGTTYGAHGLLAYPARLPEMVGLLLLPLFGCGLVRLLRRRECGMLTASFLLLFLLHTVFRAFGMLGSAGYPRYLATVAPAIALITLAGWNRVAELFSHASRLTRTGAAALLIAMSFFLNFVYADGAEMSRDARAIHSMGAWFAANPRPVAKFIWSQPYAAVVFDRDPWEQPAFTRDRPRDLALLRAQPAGTLVYWDAKLGPSWFGLTAEDVEAAGFVRLHSRSVTLRGSLLDRSWFGFGGPRRQTMHLFYKPGLQSGFTINCLLPHAGLLECALLPTPSPGDPACSNPGAAPSAAKPISRPRNSV